MKGLKRNKWNEWMRRGLLLVFSFAVGQMAGFVRQQYLSPAHSYETIRLVDLPTGEAENKKGREPAEVDDLPKKIAITFDDGPNINCTRNLLKGLKKRGVKATFFVLGAEVEKNPQILEEINEDGHQIGVHSYEHVNFGEIGDEAAIKQIEKTRNIIYDTTGEYAGFIRPPYGCWKKSLDQRVPMIEVLWDIDPLDWATQSAEVVAARILPKVSDGCIILLHDTSPSSVEAALTVIDVLKKQGYEFVTVEELLII